MTERKWKPGPWGVKPRANLCQEISSSNGITIAVTRHRGKIGAAERHANAHLIAAAPDLYEALEYLMMHADLTYGDKTVASEALARARGETQ